MDKRRSIYNQFEDDYGRDPIRERYGMNEVTYEDELRRRRREAEARAEEENAFGQELQNTKQIAAIEYETRERVDTEAQAADVLQQLTEIQTPQEVISLLTQKRKAIKDPTVEAAVNNRLKEFERLKALNEKAASLGGYFGDYRSAVEQGAAPEDAFAATQVQRAQDITRSRLEGLGIKAPEDPKELERLAVRAESMEPDTATRQMLMADYKSVDAVIKDPMTTDEEKASAREELERIRRQMMGARNLAEPVETPLDARSYIQRAVGK